MGISRIVITGAPGTGKTSVINGLEHKGFYCFHEIIRDMTAKARNEESDIEQISNPLVFVKDPYAFNSGLLYGRLKQFQKAKELRKDTCFFDRGIPDVLAYMDFFGQDYQNEFIEISQNNRYDAVFILPPWKEIYVSDNERLETFTESEKIHECLINTYVKYGYNPILVPKTAISKRVSYIVEKMNL